MDDLVRISSVALPESTHVLGFRGTEAISRPYQIEIFLRLQGADGGAFDLDEAVGAKATLRFDRGAPGVPPFLFAGILARVELLQEMDDSAVVKATLVPRLWLLGLTRHSRVFTNKSLPEVIVSVLEDNGLSGDDFEMRLGAYEIEEHVCQYRESDLDFLSRWMEREGMYYYFEHGEEGDKLILADHATYEQEALGAPVRYYPQQAQDASAGASFQVFRAERSTLPAMVKLKDYDYARPNLAVSGAAIVSPEGTGEVQVYGERFFTPAAGERLARLRAEELLSRRALFRAAGTRTHLHAGYTHTIEDHPRAAMNTRYLIVEARHHGNQSAGDAALRALLDLRAEVYFVETTAIPAKTQFRPASTTAWPRIYGHENGVIDGPADSEYAQIDEQGRYSVKLKFDESSLRDGKASTRVRMAQPHGGGVEGFHFPLRKGTEVLLTFLGGDPDRPVVTGVVPTALTPSPITAANYTRNVLQTGGRNRLELEDRAGQQRITLSTPHADTFVRMGYPVDGDELTLHTDDNALFDIGKNLDLHVGQNGGGAWHGLVKDDWSTHVQSGNYELFVDTGTWLTKPKSDAHLWTTNGNLTIDVDEGTMTTNVMGKTATNVKKGDYLVTVSTGNMIFDIASNYKQTVHGNSNQTVTGNTTKTNHGTQTTTINEDSISTTKGSSTSYTYGSTSSYFFGHKKSFELSTALSATISASASFKLAVSVAVNAGASLTINESIDISLSGTHIKKAQTAVHDFLVKSTAAQLIFQHADLTLM